MISGGGRGITAEVAVALASEFQPRLVLLGRSPVPSREEDWLAGITDEAELKRALAARSPRRLSPHELGQESRRILAEREIRRNLERITAAGSPVVYHSVDVRDGAAVQAAMARVQREFGPVRGLIHGAGVLADRKIVDQTDAQFDLVYQTKVRRPAQSLQRDRSRSRSRCWFFSRPRRRDSAASARSLMRPRTSTSTSGHSSKSLRLPQCRVVSFNWGPWAGGMVTDALKPIFEQEGLALIPLDAGARLVVEEARRGRAAGSSSSSRRSPRRAPTTARSKPAAATSGADREALADRLPAGGRSGVASRALVGSRDRRAPGLAGGPHSRVDGRGCSSIATRGFRFVGVDDFRSLQGRDPGPPEAGDSRAAGGQARPTSLASSRVPVELSRHACNRQSRRACSGSDCAGRSPSTHRARGSASRRLLVTRCLATRSIRRCFFMAR